jgi:hypothetical protein
MGPLLWTCKSTQTIAAELRSIGFSITTPTVGKTLHLAGYSLRANRKAREGEDHPDRAQLEFINRQVIAYQRLGQTVVSADKKKKEIPGNKKNARQTLRVKRVWRFTHSWMSVNMKKHVRKRTNKWLQLTFHRLDFTAIGTTQSSQTESNSSDRCCFTQSICKSLLEHLETNLRWIVVIIEERQLLVGRIFLRFR